MELGRQHQSGKCFATTKNNDLNLLGIDFIERIELWDKPINSFCNNINAKTNQLFNVETAVKSLQSKFKMVFNNKTIGHCTKARVALAPNENAHPVFRPKRPVAYHTLDLIDEELQKLQYANIISPVDYSDWAAPIVVVRKPNGLIRIFAN